MKEIIKNLVENSEKKSWEEETITRYVILIPRTIKTEYDGGGIGAKTEMSKIDMIEQSRIYPHGVTEKEAISFAGKKGMVWKRTTTAQRLK